MKVAIALLLSLCSIARFADAAGRALPIESENYVTETFQSMNRFLNWDNTNFLIDLAGQFTNCKNPGEWRSGMLTVSRLTKEGDRIQGIEDYGPSSAADVQSVNRDFKNIIGKWLRNGAYTRVIGNAEKFGCSIRPVCGKNPSQAAVVCLFSVAPGDAPQPTDEPLPWKPTPARAFTNDQYAVTERLLGMMWDRSHYLENLAGSETKCNMMNDKRKNFDKLKKKALDDEGLSVTPQYGWSENMGKTQPAMEAIIKGFNKFQDRRFDQMGCALIADCRGENRKMYVFVTCLFAERI